MPFTHDDNKNRTRLLENPITTRPQESTRTTVFIFTRETENSTRLIICALPVVVCRTVIKKKKEQKNCRE